MDQSKQFLTPQERAVSFKGEFLSFLSILFTSITVYCLLYPYLQKIGMPSVARFEEFNEFVKSHGIQRTNNIFLYVSGCGIFIGEFILYRLWIFPRILRNHLSFLYEAVFSFGFLLLAWQLPQPPMNLFILFCRFGSIGLAGWLGLQKKITNEKIFFWLENLLIIGIVILAGYFLFFKTIGDISAIFSLVVRPFFAIFLILLYLLVRWEQKFPRYLRIALDVFTVFIIFILTFRSDTHYFDYSNFICAITDVMLGKDILSNVISQYGFLNIYFLAAVFKVFSVGDAYTALTMMSSLFYFLGYMFIYLLFRVYTKRVVFSMLAVFCILVVNFYALVIIPIHWAPSVGFLRFGTFFPILYLLFSEKARGHRYWQWFLAATLVFSFFWVIEIGGYIVASIVGISIFKYIFDPRLSERKKYFQVLLKTAALFIVTILFLTVRIWLKYGHSPVWGDLVYYQRLYVGSGLGSLPLKDFYLWPVLVFIYFVAVYACAKFYDKIKYVDAWLFLSFFGLQNLLYYISLVIIDHLARVALPATILLFAFLGFLLRKDLILKLNLLRIPSRNLIYGVTVLLTVILGYSVENSWGGKSLWARVVDAPGEIIKNSQTDALAKLLPKNKIQEFRYDVLAIQETITPDEPLIIISKIDTLFAWYAQRKSFFKIAFYPNFSYTKTQVPEAVQAILKSPAKHIFIDNSPYKCYTNKISNHGEEMRRLLSQYFRKEKSLGLLDIYTRIER